MPEVASSPYPGPWAVGGATDISPMHVASRRPLPPASGMAEVEGSTMKLLSSKIYGEEEEEEEDVHQGGGVGGWGSFEGGYQEEEAMMRSMADPTNSMSQLDSPVATMKLRPEVRKVMSPLSAAATGRHLKRGGRGSSADGRMRTRAAFTVSPDFQVDSSPLSPLVGPSGWVLGENVAEGGREGMVEGM